MVNIKFVLRQIMDYFGPPIWGEGHRAAADSLVGRNSKTTEFSHATEEGRPRGFQDTGTGIDAQPIHGKSGNA